MTEITTQGMNSLAERIVTTVMPLLQGSWKPLLQRIAKYMVSACSQKEQENMHQILLRVRTWQLICLDKSFLVLISQRTVDVQQYFESLHRDLDDWQKKTQVPIGSGPLVNSEILRKQIWNQWDSLELQWPNDYKEKENAIKDAIAAFLTPNERIPLLINLICDYAKNEQGTLIQAAFDRILDSKGDICRQYYNSLGPVDDGASVPKLDSNAQKEDFPAAMVIPSLADITIVNSLGPSFGYGFQAQWRGMPVLLRMLFGQPNTNEETCANVFQKLLTKQ
jgi:hypothetical protein